jgi:hypothetical protein
MIMENFGKSCILAFAAWSTVLAGMKEIVVDAVVHGAAAEEKTDNQIKVCFEEMDNSELVQFEDAGFLVDHNVDDDAPAVQEEAVQAG